MSKQSSSGGGIGVLGLLGVAFVVLKLTGHITWSWWLVTLPFWGGLAVVAVLILAYLFCRVSAAVLDAISMKRRQAKQRRTSAAFAEKTSD